MGWTSGTNGFRYMCTSKTPFKLAAVQRPVGRPQSSYGQGLAVDLRNAGIRVQGWHLWAQEQWKWDKIISRNDVHIRPYMWVLLTLKVSLFLRHAI